MATRKLYPYVDDEVLIAELNRILTVYETASMQQDQAFYGNVVDPFSSYVEAICGDMNFAGWKKSEKRRQLQKTLQTEVGYFHQHILGSIDGWSDPGRAGGYDSENVEKKIFAEIKNKYNTMNSSAAAEIYNKMTDFLATTKVGYTGYVVIIVPRSPARYNVTFAPSKKVERQDLREVDGATYYEMCTGDMNALKLLYEALPKAFAQIKNTTSDQLKPETALFADLFSRAYED